MDCRHKRKRADHHRNPITVLQNNVHYLKTESIVPELDEYFNCAGRCLGHLGSHKQFCREIASEEAWIERADMKNRLKTITRRSGLQRRWNVPPRLPWRCRIIRRGNPQAHGQDGLDILRLDRTRRRHSAKSPEVRERAYKVAFDKSAGPFFRMEQVGGAKVLFIKASRLFQSRS